MVDVWASFLQGFLVRWRLGLEQAKKANSYVFLSGPAQRMQTCALELQEAGRWVDSSTVGEMGKQLQLLAERQLQWQRQWQWQ